MAREFAHESSLQGARGLEQHLERLIWYKLGASLTLDAAADADEVQTRNLIARKRQCRWRGRLVGLAGYLNELLSGNLSAKRWITSAAMRVLVSRACSNFRVKRTNQIQSTVKSS